MVFKKFVLVVAGGILDSNLRGLMIELPILVGR